MCGIFVLLTPTPAPDGRGDVLRALDLLRHRGPDDQGLACFDHAGARAEAPGDRPGAILGFRRLAILDLSPAGHQPMSDPSGRYTIIFNGEIYNHDALRADLERLGDRFVSRTDTEVLLRLLALRGPAALRLLDGMFALALHDRERRSVLLARDPFGIKPLYLYNAPDGSIAAASEIKAFTALPGWHARANRRRVGDFLSRGLLDHTHETMFDSVTQVPAGGLVHADYAHGRVELRHERWHTLTPRPPIGPESDWPRQVRALLDESVRRQLRADVPVGSCLSGGVDSSGIVALAARHRRDAGAGALGTITARPRAGAVDEGHFAHLLARAAGAEATDVMLDPDELWRSLGQIVWAQDEPFSSTSIFAQWSVFAEARRRGLVVMLDGQGADEVFAGYHAFFKAALLERLIRADLPGAWGELAAARRSTGAGTATQLARAAWSTSPRLLRRSLAAMNANGAGRLFPLCQCGGGSTDPFAELGSLRDVRGCSLQQITTVSLPMLLHWEDRSSMAHSIEARVPYLSPALVETALGLPGRAKVRAGVTKRVLRDALRTVVPDEILDRRDKVGFEAPESAWMVAGGASPAAQRVIDAALDATSGVIAPGGRAWLDSIRRGQEPYDRALWRAVCLGAWIDRFGVRW